MLGAERSEAVYAGRDGRCKIDSDNRGTLHKVGNRRGRRVNKERKYLGIDVVCTSSGACVYLSRLNAPGETRNGNQRVPRIRTTRIPTNKIASACNRTKERLRSMMERGWKEEEKKDK